MSVEYGPSGPAGIIVVGDHAKMMEAAKTNPFLAKLMPKMPVTDGKKQTHAGSSQPENKAEMYEDWKQALKLEGEKNDKEDGSGVLFEIVVLGDKKTGPSQERVEINVAGVTKMATPQRSVPGGRLKGRARKEARLHQTFPTIASSGYTKPTEDEEEAGTSGRAQVETGGSETILEQSSISRPDGGTGPESMSIFDSESSWQQLLEGVPAMTLTGNDEELSSDDQGLVHLDVATASASTITAEKLKEAVEADVFPSDPLTREHFGLSNVNSTEEETNLLGLYQGLLIHLPNPPSTKTVQDWQQKNTIAVDIHHSYKSQHGRSWYFDWFKDHQHFVDQTYVNLHSPMSHP